MQVGLKYGLPLLSPVDDAGEFTEEAGPFAGLQVQGAGNEAVVQVRGAGAQEGGSGGWPWAAAANVAALCGRGALRGAGQPCAAAVAGPCGWQRTLWCCSVHAHFCLPLHAVPVLASTLQALTAAGALLKEESYAHKYPYDWRTKKPTIFRATDQARNFAGPLAALLLPGAGRGCGKAVWRTR